MRLSHVRDYVCTKHCAQTDQNVCKFDSLLQESHAGQAKVCKASTFEGLCSFDGRMEVSGSIGKGACIPYKSIIRRSGRR